MCKETSNMKRVTRILALCLLAMLSCAQVHAQGKPQESRQRLSASVDLFGTVGCGINAEYSPSRYIDLGLGYTPMFLFIVPAMEGHAYARACFLNHPVQPYLQLSASFTAPGQVQDNSWFFARLGTGVKFTFGKYFYCGCGGSYTFFGKDFMPRDWNGFCPEAFAGCTVFRF